MNDELREYERRLLDYIERGGKLPQLPDEFIERVVDPEAFDAPAAKDTP